MGLLKITTSFLFENQVQGTAKTRYTKKTRFSQSNFTRAGNVQIALAHENGTKTELSCHGDASG
jgi:hypothetical protein